ncbi:hypothetical protein L7F22_042636 [Adiantum nelumboides]|nr:hypothetical protein [Adiantum nelumboides]
MQKSAGSNIAKISSQSWEDIKAAVMTRYLLPDRRATKMNEFFSLKQLSSTVEEYYSKFVSLRRYAPKMTLEQQVARFCQGLIEPLNNRLEALRPTTLQDALLRAKPLAKEIEETTQGRHDYPSRSARPSNWNNGPANQAYQSRPLVATTTIGRNPRVQCYECHEYGHYKINCPRQSHASNANAFPLPPNGRGQPNVPGGRERGNRNQGRGAFARINVAVEQPTVEDGANERAS